MHIVVDTDRCDGHGQCELAAPELFELGDDDRAHVLVDPLPATRLEAARAAALACPKRAISIEGVPSA